MDISRYNQELFGKFLEEIGERYVNLVDDQAILGIPSAYCSYLRSTGYTGCMMLIDGGNSFNPYRVTLYSRLFSVDERTVLNSIQLSRAFTCHQMSALLGDHLKSAVRRFGAGVVIVSEPTPLYMERAAEEDVVEEFLAAHQQLVELTYSRHLTTLVVHTCRLPRFLDGGFLESGRRERAGRCMERALLQLSDSAYRLEERPGGFPVTRVKHPYFPAGSTVFIPHGPRVVTLEEVL